MRGAAGTVTFNSNVAFDARCQLRLEPALL